jgi:spoIIIJ-associated protein
MEKIIATGKTVKDAVYSALEQLNTTSDNVDIKIINQPSKRLFGIMGEKDAVVEVSLRAAEIDPVIEGISFLQKIFVELNLEVKIDSYTEDEHVILELIGDDLGLLIGRRGQTIDSLQILTNLAANKHLKGNKVRIVLDAENYRNRREKTLQELAKKLESTVYRQGKAITLEPMTPWERKVIHAYLHESELVSTESVGEDPYRRVVVSKK